MCVLLVPSSLHTCFDLRWHSGIIKCLESELNHFSTDELNDSTTDVDCLAITPEHPSKIKVDNLLYLRRIVFRHFKIDDKLERPYKVIYIPEFKTPQEGTFIIANALTIVLIWCLIR